MDRDEVVDRYLSIDWYDADEVRCLLKRFQGDYIPTIRIKKEIKRYRSVGVDEQIAAPKGYLITIERKWGSRVADAKLKGKKVFPHVYYASREQIQEAPTQLWKGVRLKCLKISELEIVVDHSTKELIQNNGHPESQSQGQGTNSQKE